MMNFTQTRDQPNGGGGKSPPSTGDGGNKKYFHGKIWSCSGKLIGGSGTSQPSACRLGELCETVPYFSKIKRLARLGQKYYLYVVVRVLKASGGNGGKQQQEQTSPNHVQALISGPVEFLFTWILYLEGE